MTYNEWTVETYVSEENFDLTQTFCILMKNAGKCHKFTFEIKFPAEYPYNRPTIRLISAENLGSGNELSFFMAKFSDFVYSDGSVKHMILSAKFWKVTFHLTKIIQALEIKLVDLINPFVLIPNKRAHKRCL